MPDNKIIAYKGFDKNLKCRCFRYEVGKSYKEPKADLCITGFHACKNPHDVFGYYAPGQSRYAAVELNEVTDQRGNDSKRVGKKIKINAEVSVFDIVKVSVGVFFENFGFKKKIEGADTINAGNKGAANAGNKGAANAGNYGAANAGNCGAANAGNYGAANAGNYGAANAGDCGAANAGNYGAANAGNYGAANAGNYGAAISRIDGKSAVGKQGIACTFGGMVRGDIGAMIAIAELNDEYEIIKCKAVLVDGEKVKANTWYKLKNGRLIKVREEK
jgi:hypothetical protein